MFRVLVADSIEAEGLTALLSAGLEVDARKGLDDGPLCEAIANADAVLVRSRTKITARAIEAGKQLKLITRAGIGVDTVDVGAATRRGVIVTNVPDATTTTTAELAIALLLSLARHVPQADRNIRAGKYERAKFLGTEICGKTLGIIGLGKIGKIVADRALGLRLRVIAHDPFLPADAPPVPGVSLVSFDDLLARSDFLTLHCPLLDSTRHLLNAAAFAKARRGIKIVNAARGEIIDERALVAALRSGEVAGAALDVTEKEPLPADSELRGFEQVILTPHLGASTEEAQRRVALDAAAQIVEFARNGVARSAVNLPMLPEELREELGSFADLAERMGTLAGALTTANPRIKRVALIFRGERFERAGGERAAAPLRAAFLTGLLRPTLDEEVNPVNAPLLARERGMEILDSREPRDRDYMHRISAEVTTDATNTNAKQTLRLDGTCFGRRARLIELDGVPVDAPLEGEMLITRHADRPGMVGRIGTILGSREVNIDRVDLGTVPNGAARKHPAEAIGVFVVSGRVDAGTLDAVSEVDGVRTAHRASFTTIP
jgi:D-3-phosphoglycerate dehydrogenase